jgi:putative transposase
MAGSKEDVETVRAFFQDLRARGPGRPLACRLRRRAGNHSGDRGRLSALGAPALPGPSHAQPRHQGLGRSVAGAQSSRHRLLPGAIARELASGVRVVAPSALACFDDDFEARVAHLRLPVTHRRGARTTNPLERLFVEERRRLKIVPNGLGEKPVMKLMFGALIRAAER